MEFHPEPEEILKGRYEAALEPVYDMQDEDRGNIPDKHVFDFFDGVRMVVTREKESVHVITHYSLSMQVLREFHCVPEMLDFMTEHINSLRPKPMTGVVDIFVNESVVHFIVKEEVGNPMWN